MSDTHIHIHLNGDAATAISSSPGSKAPAKPVRKKAVTPPKPKRKASAYSKRYGAHFKKVAKKHKTKSGSWKKGGFKRAQKEAHRLARK